MSNVFDATYASTYDLIYHEKDYNAECDLLEDAGPSRLDICRCGFRSRPIGKD